MYPQIYFKHNEGFLKSNPKCPCDGPFEIEASQKGCAFVVLPLFFEIQKDGLSVLESRKNASCPALSLWCLLWGPHNPPLL